MANSINKDARWARIRKDLKKKFAKLGVTRCEVCGSDWALGFAHRFKRRFIVNEIAEDELTVVALLCNSCHDKIEFSGHENMKKAIDDIIKNRIRHIMAQAPDDGPFLKLFLYNRGITEEDLRSIE